MITMQKAKIPSHVTMHSTPSPYRLGAKEVSPPKKKTQGQNRLPFFTGSTVHSVAQNSTNCKEKYYKTGYVAGKCDVPRFYLDFKGAMGSSEEAGFIYSDALSCRRAGAFIRVLSKIPMLRASVAACIIAAAEPPTGRLLVDPYRGGCHSTKCCQNPMVSSVRRHRAG